MHESAALPTRGRGLRALNVGRPIMVLKAIRYEWLTVAWTALVAIVVLAAGVVASSVSLTAFGLDGAVECICAAIVLWRLVQEATHRHAFDQRNERHAAQIVGALLLAAAVYVTADAVLHLAQHQPQQVTVVGLTLTIVSIPVLVPLSAVKLKIAERLASVALRVDAIGNVVCWYLAIVVLVGQVAQASFCLWWFDSVASLLIVALLVRKGWAALI